MNSGLSRSIRFKLTRLRFLTLGKFHGAVAFAPERAEGEEFVAAGVAAKRGQPKHTSQDGGGTRYMFWGDALQIEVAALIAVCEEMDAQRPRASIKAGIARFATPRQLAGNAVEIITSGPAPGTAGAVAMANRTTGGAGARHVLQRGSSIYRTKVGFWASL